MMVARQMSWTLWQRHRMVGVAIGVYIALFGGAVLILGRNMPIVPLSIGVVPLFFVYFYLLGIFIHPDADVASSQSSYPSYLFTLPVNTGQLVLWPMLEGMGSVFAMGLVVGASAERVGLSWGIFTTATMLATLLAILQAVFWYPSGVPYSKVVFTFIAIPGLLTLTAVADAYNVSQAGICLGLCLIILACYAVALTGVQKARRGDSLVHAPSRKESKSTAPVRVRKPFSSPIKAQNWYEWRHQGLTLPIVVTVLFLAFCTPLIGGDSVSQIPSLADQRTYLMPQIPTYLSVFVMPLAFVVIGTSWLIGCGLKRSDVKRGDRTFQLFFGTRPMTEWELVKSKLKTSVWTVLVSWGLIVGMSLPLLFLKGSIYNMSTQIMSDPMWLPQVLAPFITWQVVARVGAGLLIVMFACWRNYAVGFWAEVSDNGWLRYGFPMANAMLLVGFLVWGATSEPRNTIGAVVVICAGIWVVVGLKIVAAVGMFVLEIRSGLLSPASAIKLALAYLLVLGTVMTAAVYYWQPYRQELVENGGSPAIFLNIVPALVLLWTPIVRILAAPMMLARNRHR